MSLQEQQTFLARLFTDEGLRRSFLQNPVSVGGDNGLEESDIAELQNILPEQLSFFADSLFYKRVQEVEKFLPLTVKVLSVDFIKLFREFSQTFTPRTVKKHLEDAIAFVGFLAEQDLENGWIKDLAGFEQAQITFNGYGKKFVFRRFKFNIREILEQVSRQNAGKAQRDFSKRRTFGVWLRVGKKTKHYIF